MSQSTNLRRGDRFIYEPAYAILGNEAYLAIADSELNVIGWLDETSQADFIAYLTTNSLPLDDIYTGIVHQLRDGGVYIVEFDVQPTRLYKVTKFTVAPRPAAVDDFVEYALP